MNKDTNEISVMICSDSLDIVIGYIEENLKKHDCSVRLIMQIAVCVEKVFVEMIECSQAEESIVRFSCQESGENQAKAIRICFEYSGEEVNPLTDLPLEEYNMIKHIMNKLLFNYCDDKNYFCMEKMCGY